MWPLTYLHDFSFLMAFFCLFLLPSPDPHPRWGFKFSRHLHPASSGKRMNHKGLEFLCVTVMMRRGWEWAGLLIPFFPPSRYPSFEPVCSTVFLSTKLRSFMIFKFEVPSFSIFGDPNQVWTRVGWETGFARLCVSSHGPFITLPYLVHGAELLGGKRPAVLLPTREQEVWLLSGGQPGGYL